MAKLFITLLGFIFSQNLAAEFVSAKKLDDLPYNFCSLANAGQDGFIKRYEITFWTLDKNKERVLSTGLVAFQKNHRPVLEPLLYLHATTAQDNVPTRGSFESKFVICRTASSKRVVLAPDYIGMTGGSGAHGFMIREEIDQATTDFLYAVSEWEKDFVIENELYIAGYSQGGHSALTVHQHLDEINSKFSVKKTFALSAPINLSGDVIDGILYKRPDKSTSYLTALVIASYQQYYGDIYDENPFKEKYKAAEKLAQTMSTKELKSILPRNPLKPLRDDFVYDLKTNENHPLRERLRENDIKPWYSSAPIDLTFSGGDRTVRGYGVKRFASQMRELGNEAKAVQVALIIPHTINFVYSINYLSRHLK